MKTDDFDYELPNELIAQTPLLKRDSSKLLVLDKETGNIEHKHFYDIMTYLDRGDTLVLNDTKVLPARLIGVKEETNAIIFPSFHIIITTVHCHMSTIFNLI